MELRSAVGARVRALRLGRRWTQEELAGRLGLSQARLSQIERGLGSFSAEQLLLIFRLFNVGPTDFDPDPGDADSRLQNALARLGASHLLESERSLPSAELRGVNDVVREVLVDPRHPRLVTALAPVLVAQADRVSLTKLQDQLAELGLARRLVWVVDSTLAALRAAPLEAFSQEQKRLYRRAELVLSTWLSGVRAPSPSKRSEDVLERSVRTAEGLEELRRSRSAQARRWGVVTSLRVEDFEHALEQADERD